MDTKSLVEEKFYEQGKCGHCLQPNAIKVVKDNGDEVVTCYACAQGYVSRIVVYGDKKVDQAKVKAFVTSITPGLQEVREQDIRTASRYPWDLGFDPKQGQLLNAVFWNQNYRGNKDDAPNRKTLFLCNKCGSFYVDSFTYNGGLCPNDR